MCLPGGFTLQGGVETALSQTDCWLASRFNNQDYGTWPGYSVLARKILHFWQRTVLDAAIVSVILTRNEETSEILQFISFTQDSEW